MRTANEAPSGFFTSYLDDGQVVPNIADDEARTVRTAQGTKAEVSEELNAHEGTVGSGKVDVVEGHRIVPILTVTAPFIT